MIQLVTHTRTFALALVTAATLALALYAPPGAGAKSSVSVKILKPKRGAKISGTVRWTARARARSGIRRVVFYVNKKRVWTDRRGPYRFGRKAGRLRTTTLRNGRVRLKVVAVSRSGAKARDSVLVTVRNAVGAQSDLTPNTRPQDYSHIRVGWPLEPGTVRSEVLRNGKLVATRTGGIGHYVDSMLWFSTTYTYTVRMFDSLGRSTGEFGPLRATTGSLPATGPPATMANSAVWAAPIPAGAATSPRSGEFVAFLAGNSGRANMSTREYGIPIYEAEQNDPLFGPFTCRYGCALGGAVKVPIPPYAQPDPGSDHHMSVISADRSTVWDYYLPAKNSAGDWSSASAAVAIDMNGSGVVPANLAGANAANFANIGGVVRPEEIATGKINHALALGVPGIGSGDPACPATQNKGTGGVIPEGVRFQLDPSLNVASLGLPAWQATIARAFQTYGGYVRDNSGVLAVYGETSSPTIGGRRYDGWALAGNGVNAGIESQTFSANFPWSRMRALAFSYC